MSIFQYPNISTIQRFFREGCQYFNISISRLFRGFSGRMSIFQYPNISIVQRLSREVCQYFTISTFQRFSKERCRASTVSSFHPCLSFRPVDIPPMLASIQKWKYQLPVPTYAPLPRDHFTSMCNKVKHLQVFS